MVEELHAWLKEQRGKLSRSSTVAKPIDYMLKRWDRFASFLDDGCVCLSNNAAERALRGFALGRRLGSSPAPTKGPIAPPPWRR